MAAGQLGGELYPTEDIVIEHKATGNDVIAPKAQTIKKAEKIKRNRAINHSFGHAIQAWNKHEYKRAVVLFNKHVRENPDSPWASEAVLHIGCDATYNGRYSEAEGHFRWIIDRNKGKSHTGAKQLVNKARQRLGVLSVYQNNFKEAVRQFRLLKEESTDWRHRTYASHWIQRLSRYKNNDLALLRCGTEAPAYVLKQNGKEQLSLGLSSPRYVRVQKLI